jgi:hypothetical protein
MNDNVFGMNEDLEILALHKNSRFSTKSKTTQEALIHNIGPSRMNVNVRRIDDVLNKCLEIVVLRFSLYHTTKTNARSSHPSTMSGGMSFWMNESVRRMDEDINEDLEIVVPQKDRRFCLSLTSLDQNNARSSHPC